MDKQGEVSILWHQANWLSSSIRMKLGFVSAQPIPKICLLRSMIMPMKHSIIYVFLILLLSSFFFLHSDQNTKCRESRHVYAKWYTGIVTWTTDYSRASGICKNDKGCELALQAFERLALV